MREGKNTGERLWARVLADLRVRAAAGEFMARFPTDNELVAHYGVSRHTVREAVRHLDGVVRRARLGGRMVAFDAATVQLATMLRALGVRLELAPATTATRPDAEVAAALDLPPERELCVTAATVLADDDPAYRAEWWTASHEPVPLAAFCGLAPPPDDVALTQARTLPAIPPDDTCAELRLAPGTPVFRTDATATPLGIARAWIPPDRFRCIATFTKLGHFTDRGGTSQTSGHL